jgi:hypothetical protein
MQYTKEKFKLRRKLREVDVDPGRCFAKPCAGQVFFELFKEKRSWNGYMQIDEPSSNAFAGDMKDDVVDTFTVRCTEGS